MKHINIYNISNNTNEANAELVDLITRSTPRWNQLNRTKIKKARSGDEQGNRRAGKIYWIT